MFKSLYPITVPFGAAMLFVAVVGALGYGETVQLIAACVGIFMGWWLNRKADEYE